MNGILYILFIYLFTSAFLARKYLFTICVCIALDLVSIPGKRVENIYHLLQNNVNDIEI